MLTKDIRQYIIAPTLKEIDLWSESSEILIYGTGFVETAYQYLMQIGTPKNGGISFWQIEPSDYLDACAYLKNANIHLLQRILTISNCNALPANPMALVWNMKLAVIFCRVHYLRRPEPLPNADNASGFAQLHKKAYNSAMGAANVDKNTSVFQEIIDGRL